MTLSVDLEAVKKETCIFCESNLHPELQSPFYSRCIENDAFLIVVLQMEVRKNVLMNLKFSVTL